ncbi:hypothetical protein [Asticcacaulis sp. YBE204]|uniref:hypothetical protein n=1 Tax=Asticcacaulis sp. YBE204 TaxID=1282363 RepID=UPI0003C40139|nr:hypothetical protein [Asticcacaulis sp. YBE204]ESQ78498.1 hypothetical protein AEYBE204_13165 [Asticcacaulis sp. YBE204]
MSQAFLIFFATASLICSLAALGVAFATFMRAGRWKDTDDGKSVAAKFSDHDRRLAEIAAEQKSLATKADISRLKAEVEGLEKIVNIRASEGIRATENVDAAVNRLETYLRGGK